MSPTPTPNPSPSPVFKDDEGFSQSALHDALVQQAQIHESYQSGTHVTQATGEFTTIAECPALEELPDSFPVHFLPAVCPDPHTASTSTMTQAEFNALMDGQPHNTAAPIAAGVILSVLVLAAAAVAFVKHRRNRGTSPAPAEATP